MLDPWQIVGFGLAAGALGVPAAYVGEALHEAYTVDEAEGLKAGLASFVWKHLREGRSKPGVAWRVAWPVALGVAVAGGVAVGGPVLAAAFGLMAAGVMLDLRGYWLPEQVNLPLIWLGLGAAAVNMGPVPASDAILAAGCVWAFLMFAGLVGRLHRGTQAVFDGDLRFGAGCGALIGLEGLPHFFMGLAAACVVLVLLWLWRGGGGENGLWMPLGPAIAAGAFIAAIPVWA